MKTTVTRAATPASWALRQARRAWRIQYIDSRTSIDLARQALERARSTRDESAEAWALLTCGFHGMRYVSAAEGLLLLEKSKQLFERVGERHGVMVAIIGIGRCWWAEGHHRESLDLLLPLRVEGLKTLTQEERGVLLNAIAGCYSMLGDPANAFAYMYQALRESSPTRNNGFDMVLYCNLSHELLSLGDYEEGLRYVQEGIVRCAELNNPGLMGVLLLNRMTCLTDLDRAGEALADVHRLLAIPADADGRGAANPSFELMALTALRASDLALGENLIARALANPRSESDFDVDERLELAIAQSELARLRGNAALAVQLLEQAMPLPTHGLGLRVRCQFFQALADAHERSGNAARALHYLRDWQRLHLERSHLASQARHQAASLKTELMRLQRERDEIDARQRSTEKARSELETANQQLAQRIQEVQSLQESLKEQAVRDGLTGLFNRRYLSDMLPGMLALARRDAKPMSVAIIDLDWFKAINDEHGHLAGDEVLKSFAALLLKQLRKSDVVCRYGGEEFCLLMPRTPVAQAQRKIEALLKQWRATRLDANGKALGPQAFSAGVVDSDVVDSDVMKSPVEAEGIEAAEDLLKRADDCALQAKRSGRDRVVSH